MYPFFLTMEKTMHPMSVIHISSPAITESVEAMNGEP